MKLIKILSLITVCSLSVCGLTACGGGASSSGGESSASESTAPVSDKQPESTPPADSSHPLAVQDAAIDQQTLDKAITSLGDTTRIKAKMQKALDGETVTVAYLGGSITEGYSAGEKKCYARLSFEKFRDAFGKDGGKNVKYVNAGISGTPSILGNLRLQRDILSKDPDIVFLEFAVNDSQDADHKAAYESIVRDLLERDVAVVLLFSRMEKGYTAQSQMKEIGAYYNIPMISYADGLTYMLDKNLITWSEFSGDYTHPNLRGHAIVADMIGYFFDMAWKSEPSGSTYPEQPLNSMVQQGMQLYEYTGELKPESMGSWTEGSVNTFFKEGWTHSAKAGSEPLTFRFRGRSAYLIYKVINTGNYGTLKVKITVDGGEPTEKTVETLKSDGWGNPLILPLGKHSAEHDYLIEISMAEGSEEMKAEIFGIAHN
ncbi:MAG: SGNH/GDSL hydrolase family protein [Ruminococcus sp.]|nr:SGNH/GDSL hydrolase family protein [Ruminococcus sp.]